MSGSADSQQMFDFYELNQDSEADHDYSEPERIDDIYTFIKFLGRGAFGTVNLYKNSADNSLVVWKEIYLMRLDSKMRTEAFAEVEILSMFDHPNIISYFKHFIGDDTLYIELEYAKGGNLTNLIKQQKSSEAYFDQETVLWFFYQLTSAVQYIHEIGIMHRDIKTLNIFLMQSGVLKLGDFGIAKILDSQVSMAETQVGTPLYMSPEIIEGKKYSNKSDIWALGCVIYELCTLSRVFDATNQLKLACRISLCEVLPIDIDEYSADLKQLIKQILSKEAEDRPSAKEILNEAILSSRLEEFNTRIRSLNMTTMTSRQNSSNSPQNKIITSKTFECYVWGGGKLIPKPIEKFKGDHAPSQVSLGPSHFAVITVEKELFTWASSQGEAKFLSAKLGHDKSYGYTRTPKQVESLSGIPIEQVSCGDDFTCCLSSSGELYTFGTDYMGCLGLGKHDKNEILDQNQSVYIPTTIPFFDLNSIKVVKISCGELHCIALTETNQIFTWGCGEHGRLGHNDEDERNEPTELRFKIKYTFRDVFAGSDFSFLLTTEGKVLAFGNNEYNKLCLNDHTIGLKINIKNIQGLSSIIQQITPKVVKKLSQYNIVKIFPGKNHTAAIDHYGRMFTFGDNRYGQLGVGDFKQRLGYNLLSGPLSGQYILNAACGDSFTICCTSENQIFSWGNRKNGRLGIDSDVPEQNSVPFPKPIFGCLHLVSDMSSCYWNSIIIAEKILATKPVKSISYAEYLRKGASTPQEMTSENQTNYQTEATTGFVANRFEQFKIDSPPINGDKQNLNETTLNQTPEWLKNDIESMDFIPMDALDRQEKAANKSGNIIDICIPNSSEKYSSLEEAVKVIVELRSEISSLKAKNQELEEKLTRIDKLNELEY